MRPTKLGSVVGSRHHDGARTVLRKTARVGEPLGAVTLATAKVLAIGAHGLRLFLFIGLAGARCCIGAPIYGGQVER